MKSSPGGIDGQRFQPAARRRPRAGGGRRLADAAGRAPLGEVVDIMDVGFATAYLATPYARRISGNTVYVDGGVHIMA
ncbi:hypothetical protein Tamer19_07730 [Cupriavidus sp. TA19]|nr:hypothetical protein CTP10_R05950 [Cupriavidus sp. P-10]GLC91365.1 hypothetical protein Tamer19_07730 [Cupriavidus sp. TA19]